MSGGYSLALKNQLPGNAKATLAASYRKAVRLPDNNFIYGASEKNESIWYILIRNIDGDTNEYKGGEYLFKMIPHNEHPVKPPRFYALTPNGLFKHDSVCCISIGEFHPENYSPTLGLSNFATSLMSSLVDREHMLKSGGINLIYTKPHDIKKMARESVAFNDKYYSEIIRELRDLYEDYSAKWDISNMAESEQKKYVFRGIYPASYSIATKEEICDEVCSPGEYRETSEPESLRDDPDERELQQLLNEHFGIPDNIAANREEPIGQNANVRNNEHKNEHKRTPVFANKVETKSTGRKSPDKKTKQKSAKTEAKKPEQKPKSSVRFVKKVKPADK